MMMNMTMTTHLYSSNENITPSIPSLSSDTYSNSDLKEDDKISTEFSVRLIQSLASAGASLNGDMLSKPSFNEKESQWEILIWDIISIHQLPFKLRFN
jgi:hypothetical protein